MERCPRKGVIEVVHTCKALTVYLHQRCSDITELAKLARQRRLESKVGHSGSRTVCLRFLLYPVFLLTGNYFFPPN